MKRFVSKYDQLKIKTVASSPVQSAGGIHELDYNG